MGDDVQSRSVGRRGLPTATLAVGAAVTVMLAGAAAIWFPVGEVFGESTRWSARVQQVIPQGWAFFTKSPREEMFYTYRAEGGGQWRAADRGPNAQLRYAFGLNRESRLTEFDVQTLVADVQDSWWVECPRDIEDVVCAGMGEAHQISIDDPNARLCGDVAIVRREPLPWAYRDFYEKSDGEIIRLNVMCAGRGE